MKAKGKEDQGVDASVLLRRGSKILAGGNIETKCGAETEGKAIQRPPPTLSSIPYIVTKLRPYCGCWEVLADQSLIWLSPERLCQSLTNTEEKARSQPLV